MFVTLIIIQSVLITNLLSQTIQPVEPKTDPTTPSLHYYSQQDLRRQFKDLDFTSAYEAVRQCDSQFFFFAWDVWNEVWPPERWPDRRFFDNFFLQKEHLAVNALSWAAINGYLNSIKFLVKERDKIFERQSYSYQFGVIMDLDQSLLNSVKYGDSNQEEIVKLLVDAGTPPNANCKENTPLDWASYRGNLRIAKF